MKSNYLSWDMDIPEDELIKVPEVLAFRRGEKDAPLVPKIQELMELGFDVSEITRECFWESLDRVAEKMKAKRERAMSKNRPARRHNKSQ